LAARLQDQAVPNNKYHCYKASGLAKRAAWAQTWRDQHKEDAGEVVTPKVPPKYRTPDFLRTEYWKLRGPLDVPKERFIAFTEVPGQEQPLFGWAGWTPLERAQALLELDEQAEQQGSAMDERVGLLYSVWFQLPYVAWQSQPAADEFRSILDSVGFRGSVEELEARLSRWAETHPPPKRPGKRRRPGKT